MLPVYPRFTIWTARSAKPLDAGWYGAEVGCLTPLWCKNDLNSSLMKHVPLSVTIVSNLAKVVLSSTITALEVALGVRKASIHLE